MKEMLTDTHAHLYLDDFKKDIDKVIQRARENGVSRIFMPNLDSGSVDGMLDICKRYPGVCYPMIGLHPTSVKENFREELNRLDVRMQSGDFIAVGEIGTDLYWDKTYLQEQQEAFSIQLKKAKAHGLPVVIHARDSFNEIFEVMDREHGADLHGVFHSFTGNEQQVEKILSYGFYIGINGIVTFKNAGLDRVVAACIPLEKLLLETDSPFLAPVPYRGKRNESAYVKNVAEKLAEVYGITVGELAEVTTENAKALFKKAN